jgi:hypothetical protein
MADETRRNMREFSRVDAVIPLEVREVPPQERDRIRSVIVSESHLPDAPVPPEPDDPVIAAWFSTLNAKLDAVLAALQDQGKQVAAISQRRVNISGGGLGFESPVLYDLGAILELKMLLPAMPPATLYVYGEVVDVRKGVDMHHIAIKYITIDDEVRDEIVKFVFKCQRDELRKRKG